MSEIILTVSEITNAIKFSLEKTFPSISVQGEVSNFKKQTSGHLYFSLKDEGAQIPCVMFKADAALLSKSFKDGDSIIIKGAMNVYPLGGRYQIVVREAKLAGLGELLLKLEELKIKIKQRGWFDKKNKKPLPKFPHRIGIVTSPTGAVIQDILNILGRRFSGLHVILNPVKVQGPGSAVEIATAIKHFNTHKLADVLIVGRGGGSIEDLFCFNEEIVAEAIFHSEIPIICAVGHETDHCIAEYVADVRAPTPSAAAEIIVFEKRELQESVQKMKRTLNVSLKKQLDHAKLKLDYLKKSPLFRDPYGIIGEKAQRLDELKDMLSTITAKTEACRKKLGTELIALKRGVRMHLFQKKEGFDQKWQQKNLDATLKRLITGKREKLGHLKELLTSLNPQALLNRGYSILFSEKDHSVIKSVSKLQEEGSFQILLSDGEVKGHI